jgi:hypothetical protein
MKGSLRCLSNEYCPGQKNRRESGEKLLRVACPPLSVLTAKKNQLPIRGKEQYTLNSVRQRSIFFVFHP